MKITNNFNLPVPLVRAIMNDPYSKGESDFSVTGLLSPPQQAHLKRLHEDELEEDASDRIWALLGQSVHHIIERATDAKVFPDSEKRIFWKIKVDGKEYVISGKPDHAILLDGVMQDYKVTSAYTHIGDVKDDWIKQLNIYGRMLFKDCPEKLTTLQVVAIYRDWSRVQMMRSDNYPRKPVAVRDIPLMTTSEVDSMVADMIRDHTADKPRACTAEERWKSEDAYALMKEGRKSAIKVEASRAAIEMYAEDKGLYNSETLTFKAKHYVELRPGTSRRCEDYCPVKNFCPQYGSDSNE